MTTSGLLAFLLLSLTLSLSSSEAWSRLAGSLFIAGNGSEQTTIEALARTFEKANPRVYVDVLWDEDSEPLGLVKTGRAHIVVTVGKIPQTATMIAADDMCVKTVVGTLPPQSAVAYLSLSTGNSAVSQCVAVRLLRVDHVEPETSTVKDGRYGLRRPLLLLSKHDPNSLVDAFADFALSPVGQAIVGEVYVPMSST